MSTKAPEGPWLRKVPLDFNHSMRPHGILKALHRDAKAEQRDKQNYSAALFAFSHARIIIPQRHVSAKPTTSL